ncbi:hypothetical protein HDU81_007097 [Chytriomyces hyalinus]|nr:hypothetical protein HDU81_007097 [Chytriomyces hyalinus]
MQITSLHVELLREVNRYRKLLRMDPVTGLAAFSDLQSATATVPHPEPTPQAQDASLESMPSEILDRIVSFVGYDSILPLCHAVPYFKYISKAMFEVSYVYPSEAAKPHDLWPVFNIPDEEMPRPLIPLQHLYAVEVYSRVLSKHGGSANVPGCVGIGNFVQVLPDALSISSHAMDTYLNLGNFLGVIAASKKRVVAFDFQVSFNLFDDAEDLLMTQLSNLSINEIYIDGAIFAKLYDTLPLIKGLQVLKLDIFGDYDSRALARCPQLVELQFRYCRNEKEWEDTADRFLRGIQG